LVTDEEIASGALLDSGTKASAPLPVVNAMASRVAKTGDMLDPESQLPPRIRRLVDWNVDVLKRLLKQIVARRNAMDKPTYELNHPMMMKLEVNIGSDTYVLNEVTEIVKLPGYQIIKDMENPNKVELPEGTEAQLRLYVASIAALHRYVLVKSHFSVATVTALSVSLTQLYSFGLQSLVSFPFDEQ
jgi:hypothetical protein